MGAWRVQGARRRRRQGSAAAAALVARVATATECSRGRPQPPPPCANRLCVCPAAARLPRAAHRCGTWWSRRPRAPTPSAPSSTPSPRARSSAARWRASSTRCWRARTCWPCSSRCCRWARAAAHARAPARWGARCSSCARPPLPTAAAARSGPPAGAAPAQLHAGRLLLARHGLAAAAPHPGHHAVPAGGAAGGRGRRGSCRRVACVMSLLLCSDSVARRGAVHTCQ